MADTLKVLFIPGGGKELSKKRISEAASEFLFNGQDVIIFSGGGQVEHNMTEAGFMRSYLPLMPLRDMLLEERSKDTYANLRESLCILQSHIHDWSYSKVEFMIATDAMQLARFRLSWRAICKKSWYMRDVKVIPVYHTLDVQRPRKDWFLEKAFWLIHLLDPAGIGPIATWNRKRRTQPSVA